MGQIPHGVRAILSNSFIYSTLQSLTGAHQGRKAFVGDFVKPLAGMTVLDVGCGLADILNYLPAVEYWGFDICEEYISHAEKSLEPEAAFPPNSWALTTCHPCPSLTLCLLPESFITWTTGWPLLFCNWRMKR